MYMQWEGTNWQGATQLSGFLNKHKKEGGGGEIAKQNATDMELSVCFTVLTWPDHPMWELSTKIEMYTSQPVIYTTNQFYMTRPYNVELYR